MLDLSIAFDKVPMTYFIANHRTVVSEAIH